VDYQSLLHKGPGMLTAQPVPEWEYQILCVILSEDGQKSSKIKLVPLFNQAG
jgi:hypothetical protein